VEPGLLDPDSLGPLYVVRVSGSLIGMKEQIAKTARMRPVQSLTLVYRVFMTSLSTNDYPFEGSVPIVFGIK